MVEMIVQSVHHCTDSHITVCNLSTALDPCSPSPCQNGGSCVSTGPPSQYSCQCVEGFEGDSCDEPLSDDSTDMLGRQ